MNDWPPTQQKESRFPIVSTRSVSVVWTPSDTQALRETADRHPTEAGTGDSDDAGLEQK